MGRSAHSCAWQPVCSQPSRRAAWRHCPSTDMQSCSQQHTPLQISSRYRARLCSEMGAGTNASARQQALTCACHCCRCRSQGHTQGAGDSASPTRHCIGPAGTRKHVNACYFNLDSSISIRCETRDRIIDHIMQGASSTKQKLIKGRGGRLAYQSCQQHQSKGSPPWQSFACSSTP